MSQSFNMYGLLLASLVLLDWPMEDDTITSDLHVKGSPPKKGGLENDV